MEWQNIYVTLTRFLLTFSLTTATIQSRIINRTVDLWKWLMVGAFLPAAILQVIAADQAWCECGGRDRNLPLRGRIRNNSHWLIPTMEPLMIYLFGNDGALGKLETIDNKTRARGRHFQRFNTSFPPVSSVSEGMSVFTLCCSIRLKFVQDL